MSSATATATAADTTVVPQTVEAEMKTYWCHECDMSVALSPPSSSSTLLCPHCHTHFLELMDSPFFPQSDSHSFPASLSLFDTPYLQHLIQNHLLPSDDDDDDGELEYDDVFEDPLSLLSTIPNTTSKSCSDSVPTITVTSSLLSQLDPGGVLCAVCKDPIGVDAQAKQLPCKHLYHSDCITPWLEHHNSCPLCRFQLVGEQEEEGASQARRIRRQLRTAMTRLSELMEEEDDFYGLRTTLSHIASRHRVLSSAISGHRNDENPSDSLSSPRMTEADSVSAGGNGNSESVSS
ncbi:E3 ubiquitin-protein ligase RING1-like [Neltuma alba]|uniref:E3 ubiquitin-protein ligase RING1-like n=1 Tax=Neltuma alba TaxID=207710 RepID=UPI0010A48141|nr:E3 ubiquitin-protein ligase RING1-like [Prosopis alba]